MWFVVCGLPVTVYMNWGCSTQLAQYSNFMDVCMMTQDKMRPVKQQAGTERNLKLNPHAGTSVATPITLAWISDNKI